MMIQGENKVQQQINNSRVKAHCGFTLLELMIVLAVIAVLLSWGMPSLTQSIRNNQVLAQGNELIAMLHFAKSEALRRNTDVRIDLVAGEDSWSATIDDPAEEVDVEGCQPGQLRCVNYTNVGLAVLDEDVEEVTYNNRGYIRSEDEAWVAETLFVQHSQCEGTSQRRRIDITPTGQISSCSLPCNSEDACQ
jgi:prepilin-type N-terminal cleavage/methylation domain-containing protein